MRLFESDKISPGRNNVIAVPGFRRGKQICFKKFCSKYEVSGANGATIFFQTPGDNDP